MSAQLVDGDGKDQHGGQRQPGIPQTQRQDVAEAEHLRDRLHQRPVHRQHADPSGVRIRHPGGAGEAQDAQARAGPRIDRRQPLHRLHGGAAQADHGSEPRRDVPILRVQRIRQQIVPGHDEGAGGRVQHTHGLHRVGVAGRGQGAVGRGDSGRAGGDKRRAGREHARVADDSRRDPQHVQHQGEEHVRDRHPVRAQQVRRAGRGTFGAGVVLERHADDRQRHGNRRPAQPAGAAVVPDRRRIHHPSPPNRLLRRAEQLAPRRPRSHRQIVHRQGVVPVRHQQSLVSGKNNRGGRISADSVPAVHFVRDVSVPLRRISGPAENWEGFR